MEVTLKNACMSKRINIHLQSNFDLLKSWVTVCKNLSHDVIKKYSHIEMYQSLTKI